MKFLYTLLFTLTSISFSFSQKINKRPTPDWVIEISHKDHKETASKGGYQYYLIDLQNNLVNAKSFRHYAIKIINVDGIQEMSDISVSYDPSYQTLEFHKIQIIRNESLIDKLKSNKINVFQREERMERSLYDGSLTAVVNLTDVREGDILEYSYTINGFNPVNKGHFSTTFYQEYTSPINRIFNRLLTSNKKEIQYKLLNGAVAPKINKTKNVIEYVWVLTNKGNAVTPLFLSSVTNNRDLSLQSPNRCSYILIGLLGLYAPIPDSKPRYLISS